MVNICKGITHAVKLGSWVILQTYNTPNKNDKINNTNYILIPSVHKKAIK
jgi:hypothetical protein